MKVCDKHYFIKTYRNYRLRTNTPEIIRTLFVERSGNISDLSNKFSRKKVEEQIYLGRIVQKTNENWELTKDGKEDINVLYAKQTPFQILKSILFGSLSKLF